MPLSIPCRQQRNSSTAMTYGTYHLHDLFLLPALSPTLVDMSTGLTGGKGMVKCLHRYTFVRDKRLLRLHTSPDHCQQNIRHVVYVRRKGKMDHKGFWNGKGASGGKCSKEWFLHEIKPPWYLNILVILTGGKHWASQSSHLYWRC